MSSNMALENGPFISDFNVKSCIDMGFSIAMFDYQRVFLDEGSFLTIGFELRSVSHDLPGVSLTGFEILRVSPVRRPW